MNNNDTITRAEVGDATDAPLSCEALQIWELEKVEAARAYEALEKVEAARAHLTRVVDDGLRDILGDAYYAYNIRGLLNCMKYEMTEVGKYWLERMQRELSEEMESMEPLGDAVEYRVEVLRREYQG